MIWLRPVLANLFSSFIFFLNIVECKCHASDYSAIFRTNRVNKTGLKRKASGNLRDAESKRHTETDREGDPGGKR